jgi:hypothetical protein
VDTLPNRVPVHRGRRARRSRTCRRARPTARQLATDRRCPKMFCRCKRRLSPFRGRYPSAGKLCQITARIPPRPGRARLQSAPLRAAQPQGVWRGGPDDAATPSSIHFCQLSPSGHDDAISQTTRRNQIASHCAPSLLIDLLVTVCVVDTRLVQPSLSQRYHQCCRSKTR